MLTTRDRLSSTFKRVPSLDSTQGAQEEAQSLANMRYRLPVTVRLPLIAATMIFVAAVASTQTAVFFITQQADRQLEAMGKIYLDGLSAALLPHVRSGNAEAIEATLRQALNFHEGIVDRRLAFVMPGQDKAIQVAREDEVLSLPLPEDMARKSDGFTYEPGGTIWVWRALSGERAPKGTVVANLDVSPFEANRTAFYWLLILFDLTFSGACALVGYFMVRQIQRPIATVARHLQDAAMGSVRVISEHETPVNDPQTAGMINAFNAMAGALEERGKLIDHLAEQQRQADLGRLAATIAHEVRNPLGGMRTAIGTLRRFGEVATPREEAITFLDRGVLALEQVVNATLESYRSRPDWRPLARQDFEDLLLLTKADAKARKVQIKLDLSIAEIVDIPALEVRQILLNLLLNAVRASAGGAVVGLSAVVDGSDLIVTVEDHGRGFEKEALRAIEEGTGFPGAGIGVSVVVRLVEQLNGRVSIVSTLGSGTRVTLTFPLKNTKPTD